MHCLLRTTTAIVAVAAALSFSPLSLVAQEASSDEAGASGAASDLAANDEVMAADETPGDPGATGEAPTEGAATEVTQTEMAAEEAIETESAPTAASGDTSEDAGADGTQVIAEGEEPEGDITIEGAPGQDGTEMADDETIESNEAEEADTGDRLAAAIASAEEAAADLQVAAARLPDIVERIDAVVAKVEGLPVEELVTELTLLATSANALVSSEATQALPADLSAALGEVEAILREFREGGVIDNANATLQSTRAAADTLPGLAERAGVLLDQAGGTLESFQGSRDVLRQAEQALREVADAADAVASLARAIESDPNSLIFGRR